MAAKGSRGTTREIKKVITMIPMRVMVKVTKRRARYWAIQVSGYLLRKPARMR
jgi:hypothetical protein